MFLYEEKSHEEAVEHLWGTWMHTCPTRVYMCVNTLSCGQGYHSASPLVRGDTEEEVASSEAFLPFLRHGLRGGGTKQKGKLAEASVSTGGKCLSFESRTT